MTPPQFEPGQPVLFIGGSGEIKTCTRIGGTWNYAIEMDLGEAPPMGRVGSETVVLLDEADLQRSTCT